MNAVLLLNGKYTQQDRALILNRISSAKRRPVIIAVDGGLGILQKLNIRPDVWVSDLDSSPRIKKGFLTDTELMFFPSKKDKTDTELALDLCLSRNIKAVDIFGWSDSGNETDHLLGNLLLPLQTRFSRQMSFCFIGPNQTVFPMAAGRRRVHNEKGKRLSIIPVTASANLTLRGVKYPATDLKVRRGQTISLRNEITANRATIETNRPVIVIINR